MRIGSQNAVCRATLFASLGWGLLTACGGTAEEAGSGGGGGSGSGGGGSVGGGGATTVTAGGFAKTKEGFEHRPEVGVCKDSFVPTAPSDSAPLPSIGACAYDVDCTEKPFGQCKPQTSITGPTCLTSTTNVCSYGCVEDADCRSGFVCHCGTAIGECIPASCLRDADCSEGELCLLEREDPSHYQDNRRFSCRAVGTQCDVDSDCSGPPMYCSLGTCLHPSVCGRPFLVDGRTRAAAAVLRADFGHRLHPATNALSSTDRPALAQHWTEVGLMEHASVAAFARFTLELLAFGAPADLVAASNAALADELEHARLAFGLAGAYRGQRVGPGPLSIDRALASSSFVDAVRTAFLEACVGETIAAIEASEARHWARDGAVRGTLDRIAADEMRHAALGYRFVSWALETSAPDVASELQSMIRRELALLLESNAVRPFEYEATALTDHGLLPEKARAASRALALADVVVPAVKALLGAATSEEKRAAATPSC